MVTLDEPVRLPTYPAKIHAVPVNEVTPMYPVRRESPTNR